MLFYHTMGMPFKLPALLDTCESICDNQAGRSWGHTQPALAAPGSSRVLCQPQLPHVSFSFFPTQQPKHTWLLFLEKTRHAFPTQNALCETLGAFCPHPRCPSVSLTRGTFIAVLQSQASKCHPSGTPYSAPAAWNNSNGSPHQPGAIAITVRHSYISSLHNWSCTRVSSPKGGGICVSHPDSENYTILFWFHVSTSPLGFRVINLKSNKGVGKQLQTITFEKIWEGKICKC